MRAEHAEYLITLAARLQAAGRGERGAIIEDAARFLGLSRDAVYRRLAEAGLESGRKTRSDRGRRMADAELAVKAAGLIQTATRASGKRVMTARLAREILRHNGLGATNPETGEIAMPSTSTLLRAMRDYGCHPDQLRRGAPSVRLKSLHPNHVWEMDASVCVLFYLPKGAVRLLDEKVYNDHKPARLEKVASRRIIRWVISDHASGYVYVRYTQGNEDAQSAIETLIAAMCSRRVKENGPDAAHDHFCGAPKILFTDNGSAYVSGMTQGFLSACGIRHITHAPGAARATGQVEQAQNLVEREFESRLRFLDAHDLACLNAQADAWRVAWNASAVHSRHGLTRLAAWMRIAKEQLRVPESAEALRAIVASPAEERSVPDSLILSYKPKSKKFTRQEYALHQIPDLAPGDKISIRVNPFTQSNGAGAVIDVSVTGLDGQERIYTLKPIVKTEFGFEASAPVLGESFSARKETRSEKALKRIRQEAYGAADAKEAEKARAAGRRAYAELDVMADVKAARPDLYLPKRGAALETAARARELPPLTAVEAARRLIPALAARGREWTEEDMAFLLQSYPQGVPAELVDEWISTCSFGGVQGQRPCPPEAAYDVEVA